MDFDDIAAAFCADEPFGTLTADPVPSGGAFGENAVGAALSVLDDGWVGLDSLPIGPGTARLDHLVVGPGGVFAINTRRHPGRAVWVCGSTFVVARQRMPYVRGVEHDSERVRRLLGETLPVGLGVTPLIVLVDPGTVSVRRQPTNAVVLDVRGLARWLRRRPVVLDPSAVSSLAEAAVRASARIRAAATA